MPIKLGYETVVVKTQQFEVRVSVEVQLPTQDRNGNWFSCVTDRHGNILGGQTNGSGDSRTPALRIAERILREREKEVLDGVQASS